MSEELKKESCRSSFAVSTDDCVQKSISERNVSVLVEEGKSDCETVSGEKKQTCRVTPPDCNAEIYVCSYYWLPEKADRSEMPDYVELRVEIGALSQSCLLHKNEMNAANLMKKCPLVCMESQKSKMTFHQQIRKAVTDQMLMHSLPEGYYLKHVGATWLPNQNLVFVRGNEVIGACDRPYKVDAECSGIHLLHSERPTMKMFDVLNEFTLETSPRPVLLLSYAVLSTIRSVLRDYGIPFQGVLYLYGPPSTGKTTAVQRIFGTYQDDKGQCVGIAQAGSTSTALEEQMRRLRDQPLVIDDLCRSESKRLEKRRIETVSKIIRQATGDIPIIKKSGKNTVSLPNESAIVMTSEFALENLSDCNRLLLVSFRKAKPIPNDLTPACVGDILRLYSQWFTWNWRGEIQEFRKKISSYLSEYKDEMCPRMCTNYACLEAAFDSLMHALRANGLSETTEHNLRLRMKGLLNKSIDCHIRMIARITAKIPLGNLSYYLLLAIKEKQFKMTKRVEDLSSCDGIEWKKDICLKYEAVVRVLRGVYTYRDWSGRKIMNYFRDIGALDIQESNGYTVRLAEGTPRVCRFKKKVLEMDKREFK